MILILAIEVFQILLTAWALHVSIRQFVAAESRRKFDERNLINGSRGLINRIRSERDRDRVEFQTVFLVCGSLLLLWRFFNLDRPPAVVPSLVIHIPILYGSHWVWRATRKELRNRVSVQGVVDKEDAVAEAQRVEAVRAAERLEQAAVAAADRVEAATVAASNKAEQSATVNVDRIIQAIDDLKPEKDR